MVWESPEDMTDFDYYEVNCTGPSTFDTFMVKMNSITVVNITTVSVKTVNRCGQKSEKAATIGLPKNNTCECIECYTIDI